MYKPIFCTSQNLDQSAIIVNKLKEAGFSNNEVSVLFPDNFSTELPIANTRDSSKQAKQQYVSECWRRSRMDSRHW